jgi:hypothetical protein
MEFSPRPGMPLQLEEAEIERVCISRVMHQNLADVHL